MTMTEAEATDLFRRPPALHLDVGVGEFAYRRVGAGPDVLFVHGWPVCGATFRHLLPHLAAHLTCHLIDLPGAGDSRYAPDAPITRRAVPRAAPGRSGSPPRRDARTPELPGRGSR